MVRALSGERAPSAALRALQPLPDDLDEQIAAEVSLAMAWVSFASGKLDAARAEARVAADVLLGAERLTSLVLVARCELWAGDAVAAAKTVAEIEALGVRGRAANAHLETIRAGLAAADGPSAAVEPYADAAAAWRALDLRGLLALCLVDACRLTGSRPSPELGGLLDDLAAGGLRKLVAPGNRRTRAAGTLG